MLLLFLPFDGFLSVPLVAGSADGSIPESKGIDDGESEAANVDGVLGTGDDETDVAAEGVMICGGLDAAEGDMAFGDDMTEGTDDDASTGEGVMADGAIFGEIEETEGDDAFKVGAGVMPATTDGDTVLGGGVAEGEDAEVAVGATGEGFPVALPPGTVVASPQQTWLNTVVKAWHVAVLETYGTKAAPS